MKIYTKTGDAGETSLIGGNRVAKSDMIIEVIGKTDELNSYLGIVVSELSEKDVLYKELVIIQKELFFVGSSVVQSGKEEDLRIGNPSIDRLEDSIDKMSEGLPELKNFIIPGGEAIAAKIFYARSICRNLERKLVALNSTSELDPNLLKFMNRLSDWLFVAARSQNLSVGKREPIWKGSN